MDVVALVNETDSDLKTDKLTFKNDIQYHNYQSQDLTMQKFLWYKIRGVLVEGKCMDLCSELRSMEVSCKRILMSGPIDDQGNF